MQRPTINRVGALFNTAIMVNSPAPDRAKQLRLQSRCVYPRVRPLVWVFWFDSAHTSVTQLQQFIDALPEIERDDLWGQIQTLRNLAAEGSVPDSREFIKAMRPDANAVAVPTLFELRWQVEVGRQIVPIRQYHVEPDDLPEVLLALHIHIKRTDGDQGDISRWQDQEIAHARARFVTGSQGAASMP